MSANIDLSPQAARYQASPFLLLLDCYVLDAIGELAQQQREALEKLEPKLHATFGCGGSWREVVETQLGLMPTVAFDMEMAWAAYQEAMASAGGTSSAGEFVREFVAQNFPALLGDDAPGSAETKAPGAKARRTRKGQ
jgi:hypothetical protein